jgi:hypothetical protein
LRSAEMMNGQHRVTGAGSRSLKGAKSHPF